MRATADPSANRSPSAPGVYPPNARADAVCLPRPMVAHWAELVAFAIDNPPECIDALLELAAELEEAAGVAA